MAFRNCISVLLLTMAPFANAVSVYWSGPNHYNKVQAGDTFYMDLSLARDLSVSDDILGGYDLTLRYDSTAFKLNTGWFSDSLGDYPYGYTDTLVDYAQGFQVWDNAQEGELHLVNVSYLTADELAARQTVARLFVVQFTAQPGVMGDFNFVAQFNEAVSASGAQLNITSANGTVQVVPLPAALGLLLAGISGLLGCASRRLKSAT